jgi:hypothetical protein
MNFGGFAVKVGWIRPQNVITSDAGEKRRRADLSGENKLERSFFRLRDCGNFKLARAALQHVGASQSRAGQIRQPSGYGAGSCAFWF